MVTTRRSSAEADLSANLPQIPTRRRETRASGTPETILKPLKIRTAVSRNPSKAADSTALSKLSSKMDEPTLTSPVTPKRSRVTSHSTLDHSSHQSIRSSDQSVVATLHETGALGSSQNPIVFTEDSPRATAKGKNKRSRTESHEFHDRDSRPYTSEAPRTALTPKPTNRSMVTGLLSSSVHRKDSVQRTRERLRLPDPVQMRFPASAQHSAMISKVDKSAPRTREQIRLLPKIQMRFSLPTQHLTPSSKAGTTTSPALPTIQHFAPQPRPYAQPPPPLPLNEDQLRKKAAQYVQEYWRPPARPADPTGNPPLQHPTPIILPDPHFHLGPLVEQVSLLNALLRAYPHSTDAHALRAEIGLLASVQGQHLADWLEFEAGQSRKAAQRQQGDACGAGGGKQRLAVVDGRRGLAEAEVEVKRRERDEEMRRLLAADGVLWRDGSGVGVADVYGAGAGGVVDGESGGDSEDGEDGVGTPVGSVVALARYEVREGGQAEAAGESHGAASVDSHGITRVRSDGACVSSPLLRRDVPSTVDRVARTVSLPAMGMDGRTRMAPARVRSE
ncbi:hypothetical protein C7974DRAFT_440280 [Boeremia exigua]|uniref:uncharacterized protein n=1 Tax=Boeremia exigua TaxID=749465 RepID=UPI001E8E848A|nr:uncharacterized protein C7974DRAFT_440280 [Boeremia exigua]KAH6644738.1 hypothetical protein C7974DRAFT_440280 [Boeremia exigua]